MNKMKQVLVALTAMSALLAAGTASSQPYGPGMMGGWGWGPGGGMGPGMMGGWGPGMMGPGMMGPGMMGPGMMGGWGGGPGMMGGWGYNIPDLTNEQRTKMAEAQQEYWRKQSPLMQQMHSQMWAWQSGDQLDEQAARRNYDSMAAVRKQMFENGLELRKRMESILTPKQREEMRRGGQR